MESAALGFRLLESAQVSNSSKTLENSRQPLDSVAGSPTIGPSSEAFAGIHPPFAENSETPIPVRRILHSCNAAKISEEKPA